MQNDIVRLRKHIKAVKLEIKRAEKAIVAVADDETEADTIKDLASQLSTFLEGLATSGASSTNPMETVNAIQTALFLGGWQDVIQGRTTQRAGARSRRMPDEIASTLDEIVSDAVVEMDRKFSKTLKNAIGILPTVERIAAEQGKSLPVPLTPNAVLESLRRIKIDRHQ